MTWETVPLGELVELRYGKALKAEDREGTSYPVIGSGGVVGSHADASVHEPTIVIGRKGSIGSLTYAADGCWPIDTAYFIILRTEVDLRWLYWTMQSLGLESMNRSAAVPGLNRNDVYRARIPLPPLTEQRRIAAILDEADALRTLHRGSLENLERLRVAHFETSFANARFAPTVIADVVAEVPNALRTGPFGSDLLHSEFVDDGVPVLGIDNVVSNEFVWAKPRFITQEKYESLKRYTVRGGDVLITIMGTVGRCGVVPDDIDQAINTKHLCCITLDQSRCLPDYLHDYFLYHPTAREYLRKTAKGAVMDGLNMGIIKQMPIVLPSIEAQHHYVSQITEVSTLADTAKSRDVDTLFASLQHRAFRGEL
ncbi:restriction endonuclease subunit S [Microbacterium memoriense]|uniref:Restriction endonuclease subunit S n=1 Tax=Microbacterium memoriense TaxID=2978350 RepID=A0ABT2P9W1_9MICO|nr:restriction endonuclease subunit S [Microbacterium memoriense]MCT9001224.1 restriction endonuclease subunit S [Microbacterium memoriense]